VPAVTSNLALVRPGREANLGVSARVAGAAGVAAPGVAGVTVHPSYLVAKNVGRAIADFAVERATDRLEVVGIAIDFRDAARKYANDAGIDYPVLVGEQGGYEAVGAFGMDPVLPFSAFADPAGRIVTLKVGELHRDEAEFILDRMRELDQGRLSLASVREQIAAGISRLNMRRAAAADGAAH